MKLITAYLRADRAAQVLRLLHDCGIGGVSAYLVHGLSGECSTFLHSNHPFDVTRLPESLKIEIICDDDSLDRIIGLITQEAKTGLPGDGLIAIQAVEQVHKVRDL